MEMDMINTSQKKMPYAPAGSVLTVIRRYRAHGAPKTVDVIEITRVGVSSGNAPRTIAALKFLGIVDDNGKFLDRLSKASTEEYPDVLGDIVRDAYSNIFTITEPSTATEVQISDAFRGYDPEKQRSRMVQLFIGLCQEANIRKGKPTVVEGRKNASITDEIVRKKPQEMHPTNLENAKPYTTWDANLQPAINLLPRSVDTDGKAHWKKSERDRFLTLVTAIVDAYAIVNDKEG
jgi:hypothetical protein